MSDLYIKIDGDPGYNPNIIEVVDEVLILLGQIEMLLFTRKGDVLGAPTMGIDLEDMIYSLTVSAGVIETAIYNQIQNYCTLANKYKVDVNVRFFKGTERDIAVVDILVDGARKSGLVIS